jgi:hypothetical protein
MVNICDVIATRIFGPTKVKPRTTTGWETLQYRKFSEYVLVCSRKVSKEDNIRWEIPEQVTILLEVVAFITFISYNYFALDL